ncbi:hypothetical protein EB796_011147 [Bugula neritina]|uniref:Uncharacterized protein n=1 Tax=Bugula neritina TaxID=10212 RepID=A0A7J7JYW3_BUGNE|nr:hypothetical protein EB796_011147 [Bugula neritina]
MHMSCMINRHQDNKTWWQRNLMVNLKDGRHFTTWIIEFKGRRFVRKWRRWIRSFEDYLLAIDLTANSRAAEKRKLALFRHCGGEDVREIYSQMEFNLEVSGEITEIEDGLLGES